MRGKVTLVSVGVFMATLVTPTTLFAGGPGPGVTGAADLGKVTERLRAAGDYAGAAAGVAGEAAGRAGGADAADRTRRAAPGAAPSGTAAGPKADAAASGSVTIVDFSYSPRDITVNVGDTVTWTNQDSELHDATADDGSFGTPLLDKGESASVTFDQPGTFSYFCSVHPPESGYPNFTGTVTVAGGGTGSGTSGDGDGGGGGSGSTGGASGTGAVSESDATAAADAAGTSSKLPATGLAEIPLALLGAVLLGAGIVLRLRLTRKGTVGGEASGA